MTIPVKPIIAFDLDDVLADSTVFWHAEVNRRTGANLTLEHWKIPGDYSGYYTRLWESHGIGHLFSVDDIDAHMEIDQSGIRAIPEALEVLAALAQTYELVVITARHDAQEQATTKWLDSVYPDIFSKILFANGSKGLAQKNKGDICKEIGAQWLIDDNPRHCMDALEKGVDSVLFGEFGWHVDVPANVAQCKTWQDVERYFDAAQRHRA